MVGKQNSTILTVSYGTFSCTLEGFDDSFGMMKAIAEYFRDLASDDRYFGAEPPTPDADMLAKIAEQEVSRRVEARTENGGVTLRPYQIEEATPAEEPVQQSEPAVEDVAEKPAPKAQAFQPQQTFVEEADAFFSGETQGAMLDEESVAARLKRIREAAKKTVVDEVHDAEEVEEIIEDVLIADDVEEASDSEEVEEIIEEVLDTDQDVEADAVEAETLAEDEDVSLQFEEREEEVSEEDIADLMALDGADAEATPEEAIANATADEDHDEELEALLGSLDTDTHEDDSSDEIAENVFEASSEIEDETFEDEEGGEDEPIQARILHVKGAALQDMEELSESDLIGFDDDAYETPENEVDVDSLNAIFDEAEQPELESSLNAEEEADLMRELAEAEADETDEDGEWDSLLDADTEAVIANQEQILTSSPEQALASAQDLSSLLTNREADDEMGRLMAETETQLSEPEHTRRKTTIQHLKAAFAAKRADGDDISETKGNDSVAYREDLELAVKPRRPVIEGPRKTQRLEAVDAAPLKLVAEQRVVPDLNKSEPAARPTLVKPVRPRRVRNSSAAVAEDFDMDVDAVATTEAPAPKVDFQTFASHMGVEKLPELLEAAASYMTFVEEYEKFSRPQVMTMVREVLGEDYTREDGLRAFGQLLREGKLVRLSGGRFTVSDGIGFQPN